MGFISEHAENSIPYGLCSYDMNIPPIKIQFDANINFRSNIIYWKLRFNSTCAFSIPRKGLAHPVSTDNSQFHSADSISISTQTTFSLPRLTKIHRGPLSWFTHTVPPPDRRSYTAAIIENPREYKYNHNYNWQMHRTAQGKYERKCLRSFALINPKIYWARIFALICATERKLSFVFDDRLRQIAFICVHSS